MDIRIAESEGIVFHAIVRDIVRLGKYVQIRQGVPASVHVAKLIYIPGCFISVSSEIRELMKKYVEDFSNKYKLMNFTICAK